MKKYININAAILIAFTFLISGCSDDYFDVNTPTGAANEDQLRMNDLLGPAIFHTVEAQYWAERSFGNYSQYFTGQTGQASGATEIAGAWSNIYLSALPSLNTIIKKADATNSNHIWGISNVLLAINLGLATDRYYAHTFSEAAPVLNKLQSAYHPQ